jgi:hypothetical protein
MILLAAPEPERSACLLQQLWSFRNSECHCLKTKVLGLLAMRVETDESNHMS